MHVALTNSAFFPRVRTAYKFCVYNHSVESPVDSDTCDVVVCVA